MTSTTHLPGFRRRPRVADRLTSDHLRSLDRSIAAERAGDAAAALEAHREIPLFDRGRHRAVLERLAGLGDRLPPWVYVRWMIYQATRCEDPGLVTSTIQRRALGFTLRWVHPDLLEDCFEAGGDHVQVAATVLGESWFFHQFFTYEAGGLENFVLECVTKRLADHGTLAMEWSRAPLGGFQLGGRGSDGLLEVYVPGADRAVRVLDLGARSCAGPDGWVLGRLVPSGVDDLRMFESPPLPVPESVATDVAESDAVGPDVWLDVLEPMYDGELDPEELLREDYELGTDVQELDLLMFGTAPRDRVRVLEQLRDGRDEIGRAAYRVLSRAREGRIDEDDAAYVAAAALNPHAAAQLERGRLGVSGREAWQRWAELVPEPGRSRLLWFAARAAESA